MATLLPVPAPPWAIRVEGHPPTLNDRLHPLARYRICKPFKEAAAWQARQLVLALRLGAPLERARVEATLVYRRRPFRDPDAAVTSLKPLLDGLVAGGLLADDGPTHVDLAPVHQELGHARAVVLHITPLDSCPAPRSAPGVPSLGQEGGPVQKAVAFLDHSC